MGSTDPSTVRQEAGPRIFVLLMIPHSSSTPKYATPQNPGTLLTLRPHMDMGDAAVCVITRGCAAAVSRAVPTGSVRGAVYRSHSSSFCLQFFSPILGGLFSFCVTPGDTQGLHSGMTPGGARGTIWDAGNQAQVGRVQGKCPTRHAISPTPHFYYNI